MGRVKPISDNSRFVLAVLLCIGVTGWALCLAGMAEFSDAKGGLYNRREYSAEYLFLIAGGIWLLSVITYFTFGNNHWGLFLIISALFGSFTCGLIFDHAGHTIEIGFREPYADVLQVIPCEDAPGHTCDHISNTMSGATLLSVAVILAAFFVAFWANKPTPPKSNWVLPFSVFVMAVGLIVYYVGFLRFVTIEESGKHKLERDRFRRTEVPAQYEEGEFASEIVFAVASGIFFLIAAATRFVTKREIVCVFILLAVLVGAANGAAFDHLAHIIDTGHRTNTWPPVYCPDLDTPCDLIKVAIAGCCVFLFGLNLYLLAVFASITGDIVVTQLDPQAYFDGTSWFALYPRADPVHGEYVEDAVPTRAEIRE